MDSSEYIKHDAIALADLVRRKVVTPKELMECAIRLATHYSALYNITCYEKFDQSLAIAEQYHCTKYFAGLPFLLKDSGIASTRFPSSSGSNLFQNTTFDKNATLVNRFERVGLIPFARTQVPELCMAPTTESVFNGKPTLNPWDISRSAGGSSGGAAVAVSTGIVPMAHGSDGGGSIRIPASSCGVFGFKPSRTLLPLGPNRGESLAGMATDGVLSRTVRDSALLLDMVRGYELGGPYASPPQRESFLASTTPNLKRPYLKIGLLKKAWCGIPIAGPCLDAVDHTAALCEELGHQVIEVDLPTIDYERFIDAHCTILSTAIVVGVDAKLNQLKRSLENTDLEPAIRDGYLIGKTLGADKYAQAISFIHSVGRQIEESMNGLDLMLTPSLTQLPVKLGVFEATGGFREFRNEVASYTTFLAIINASGQPAANVPLYWLPENLPVGIQLIGHFGEDDVVFRLAAELERLAPWHARFPSTKDSWHSKREAHAE